MNFIISPLELLARTESIAHFAECNFLEKLETWYLILFILICKVLNQLFHLMLEVICLHFPSLALLLSVFFSKTVERIRHKLNPQAIPDWISVRCWIFLIIFYPPSNKQLVYSQSSNCSRYRRNLLSIQFDLNIKSMNPELGFLSVVFIIMKRKKRPGCHIILSLLML